MCILHLTQTLKLSLSSASSSISPKSSADSSGLTGVVSVNKELPEGPASDASRTRSRENSFRSAILPRASLIS